MSVAPQTGAESTYFAQPYNLSATGFYFTDLEDYNAKASKARDDYGLPVEEFEIQYIDGDEAELFAAAGVTQASLRQWFDLLDELDGDADRIVIARHLLGLGYAMDDLTFHLDDYSVYHGSRADYARETVEECYQVPGNLAFYIDYDWLGRDMELEGAFTGIGHNLLVIGG
jgi:hypothetical protein